MEVLEVIYAQSCIVYTEEYAEDIVKQFAKNCEANLKPDLFNDARSLGSRLLLQYFKWNETPEGIEYWNRIHEDFMEYEENVWGEYKKSRK
jgi:hypothetical protein